MATRKKSNLSKLSPNAKFFAVVVIILAALMIFGGGVPQIAKFTAPATGITSTTQSITTSSITKDATADHSSKITLDFSKDYYSVYNVKITARRGGNPILCGYEYKLIENMPCDFYALASGSSNHLGASELIHIPDPIAPGIETKTSTFIVPNITVKKITGEFPTVYNGNAEACPYLDELNATIYYYTFPLTITKTGKGTVTSSPSGISCGTQCTANYNEPVVLTATADSGNKFMGWGGDACSSTTTTTCTVDMNQAKTVTATFKPTYTLTTAKSGSGTVTSSDSKINCGSTCSASYVSGTTVTLTAAPAMGTFGGWSGVAGCSGLGTCTVTLGADTTVTATFNAPLANGANCTSSSQCYSGYCNPTSKKCEVETISCGHTTCIKSTQKCCAGKCYAKTATCSV